MTSSRRHHGNPAGSTYSPPELPRVLRALAQEAVVTEDGPHPTAKLEPSPPDTRRVVLG
jgi:hypothetical protein